MFKIPFQYKRAGNGVNGDESIGPNHCQCQYIFSIRAFAEGVHLKSLQKSIYKKADECNGNTTVECQQNGMPDVECYERRNSIKKVIMNKPDVENVESDLNGKRHHKYQRNCFNGTKATVTGKCVINKQ